MVVRWHGGVVVWRRGIMWYGVVSCGMEWYGVLWCRVVVWLYGGEVVWQCAVAPWRGVVVAAWWRGGVLAWWRGVVILQQLDVTSL